MRLVAVTLVVLSVAAGSAPASTFVIEGRGWGHGVGMSQWGAEGLAAHGWEYRRILSHYYPHTSLQRVAGIRVRVLLAEGRARLSVASNKPFLIRNRRGRSWRLHGGSYTVGGSLTFRQRGRRLSLRPPLRFDPGGAPLTLDRTGFRGSLLVVGAPGSLDAVNVVPLERYLRGVVPSEEPFYWNTQALAAQAVAARTYAVANLKPGQAFDLFADTRDQVYGGIPAERASTNLAVGATSGEILTWRGRAVMAYYSSTSGGRTQAISDFRPELPQVPYLVSVPDPYDAISPHHDWGPLRFSGAQLARRLSLPGVRQLSLVRNRSGRVASVRVRWRGGAAVVPGSAFQAELGLRSTWFTVRDGRGRVTGAPAGRYIVVLASIPAGAGREAAARAARNARAAGAPKVGVLVSASYPSLRPGYYVVFSGRYVRRGEAEAAARAVRRSYPLAYARAL